MIKGADKFWAQSTLVDKLFRQRKAGQKIPRLLLTDIDGTFIDKAAERGDNDAVAKLVKYIEARNYGLVAVTGRSLSMMLRDYKKGILPLFDVVITAVGTERYILKNGTYVVDKGYERFVQRLSRFNREQIYPYCKQFIQEIEKEQYSNPQLSAVQLTLQPRDRIEESLSEPPQPYKISFNFYGNEQTVAILVRTLRRILDGGGYKRLKIVTSVDSIGTQITRYNLDIVPIEKDGAANLLLKELDDIVGAVFGVYAGDSMNDYQAIRLAGHGAIVVGGADTSLLERLEALNLNPGVQVYPHQKGLRYMYIEQNSYQRGPSSLLSGLRSFESLLGSVINPDDRRAFEAIAVKDK